MGKSINWLALPIKYIKSKFNFTDVFFPSLKQFPPESRFHIATY